jgi:phosphatidylinositol alpha-1,6-mannosyltransferase
LDFSAPRPCKAEIQQMIEALSKTTIQGKFVLLTLGRLIPRKGHAWFIKNVFTQLPENTIYLIAGAGQETQNLRKLRQEYSLDDRVFLLGYVSEEEKACLFQLADLFIMPNIRDENDQEGFGIVLLEAGSYNLPSIATDIEGIRDAVIDSVSGKLIPEGDADAFIKAIKHQSFNRKQISMQLQNKFDWKTISKRYLDAFQSITGRI